MHKNRLKEIRLKNNLTQEELAEKMRTEKNQISRWERGESIPRSEALIDLSKILGVSVDYLLGLSEEPTIRIRLDNLTLEEIAVISAMRQNDDREAVKIIVNREKRPSTAV